LIHYNHVTGLLLTDATAGYTRKLDVGMHHSISGMTSLDADEALAQISVE
jgi:hypothetical protein